MTSPRQWFVEVFGSLNTVGRECKLSTWVTGIAKHGACAVQRRNQPKNGDSEYQDPDETDEQWEEKRLASEDRNLLAVTAKVNLDSLLETLSPESRTLVEIYTFKVLLDRSDCKADLFRQSGSREKPDGKLELERRYQGV